MNKALNRIGGSACLEMESRSPPPGDRSRSSTQTSKPSRTVPIVKRLLKLVALFIVSWCVMTFVHESGHVICGCASGGTLQSTDLVPWHLPYSSFEPDPHPLITLWGGPILGVVTPATVAFAIQKDWMWLIAYFCMLANGAYIATAWASGDRYLDTPKLLEHGAHPIWIGIYCLLTIAFGYVGFRRQCVRVLSPIPVGTKTIANLNTTE